MDKKEFGKLIAALRQDMEWTQFNLSEYADVDLAVISQIERGVKKHIEPEMLVKLANTFQLTTLERREFFFAATGINSSQLVRQPSAGVETDAMDADKSLMKMVRIVEQLRVPAFLVDVYSDVLAANLLATAFFMVPSPMLETAPNMPGGYNAIRIMFSKDLATRSHIDENWDEYALNSMRSFREISLRYRAKPYFQYLIKAFRNPTEYPLFNRYWKLVSSVEKDRQANVDIFTYRHTEYGRLHYSTATAVSLTPYGELYLDQYLPLDDHTSQVFDHFLSTFGQSVVRLAPWPVKPMP